MERVEVRLNLEVPKNTRFSEVRELIASRFESVQWLDLCEDDHRVTEDRRPLIGRVPRVTTDLNCEFIDDETYPDWTVVEPGIDIEKEWTVTNNGLLKWPEGTSLKQCWDHLGKPQTAHVPLLDVGEAGSIRIPIAIPSMNGPFRTHYRLFHPEHGYFGHELWCNVVVREGSSVQVLDDLDLELPPCFDGFDVQLRERNNSPSSALSSPSRNRVKSGPVALNERPPFRLEAEVLPESLINGALSACSSIFNVAKALIESRQTSSARP